MVSVLAFYSNDPSLKPAEACSFFSVYFVFEKNKKTKRGRGLPIKNFQHSFIDKSFDYYCGDAIFQALIVYLNLDVI